MPPQLQVQLNHDMRVAELHSQLSAGQVAEAGRDAMTPRELLEAIHRLVQELSLEGATGRLPGRGQLGSPARGFVIERYERADRARLARRQLG